MRLEVSADLSRLLPTERERMAFSDRWPEFLASDPAHESVFSLSGDRLRYRSEELVPEPRRGRTPLLLVLGNPAGHSIQEGMFFSYEGKLEHGRAREHRFWKVLRDAGVADLVLGKDVPVKRRNHRRKLMLLGGEYDSRFLVGLTVVLTWPSPASVQRWSGVDGLRALLGRPAVRRLLYAERVRLEQTIHSFVGRRRGAVVAFQKDAWETLRSPGSLVYTSGAARSGQLAGETRAGRMRIPLLGIPPTRLSGPAIRVLRRAVECL